MFYQNSSITAIQLSILFLLLLKYTLQISNRFIQICISLLLIFLLFVIILLQSRTAELGLLTGVIYVTYPYLRKWYNKDKVIFTSTIIVLSTTLIMGFFIKVESSAGRIFIWRNSLEILKHNWITGVGIGKFNPTYNHYQAAYFSQNSITDITALRADDGYFAFNEWLHIWIETGIIGFILFLSLSIILVYISILNIRKKNYWYGLILIPLFVACMFSYPLHNWLLFLLGVYATVFCIIEFHLRSKNFNKSKQIIKFSFLIFSFVSVIWLGYKIYFYYQFQKSENLATEGYTNAAYIIATNNFLHLNKDYRFTTFYINLLYSTNRIDETLIIFNKTHEHHCNQILHSIAAKAYNEKNDSLNAEIHFMTALYIAPYRLQSRQDLLEFYLNRKDTVNAKKWAKEIINCPMKIVTSKGLYLVTP